MSYDGIGGGADLGIEGDIDEVAGSIAASYEYSGGGASNVRSSGEIDVRDARMRAVVVLVDAGVDRATPIIVLSKRGSRGTARAWDCDACALLAKTRRIRSLSTFEA